MNVFPCIFMAFLTVINGQLVFIVRIFFFLGHLFCPAPCDTILRTSTDAVIHADCSHVHRVHTVFSHKLGRRKKKITYFRLNFKCFCHK